MSAPRGSWDRMVEQARSTVTGVWAFEPVAGPIRMSFRWQLRPFVAEFEHQGRTYSMCRWTPWAARERAEWRQDGLIERSMRMFFEDLRQARQVLDAQRRFEAARVATTNDLPGPTGEVRTDGV